MTISGREPLVVVGDYAWDVLIRTESALLTGGDIFGSVQLTPGGSAANTAVWARRCGLPTTFVGKIGNDRFGALAEAELAEEDVSALWLRTSEHLTGSVAVWVDHRRERSMVSGKGADHYLQPEELPRELLTRAGHLHLSGWSFFDDPPRSAARAAARLVRAAGGSVSFDPGSFQMIDELGVTEFLALTTDLGVSVLFPNLEEGQVLSAAVEPVAVAARLAELYPGAVIALKLDARGSYVLDGDHGEFLPARPAALSDATGAGDAFGGAFLAAWLRGAPAAAAARAANGVGSWVIERVGARPPGDAELDSLLHEVNRSG